MQVTNPRMLQKTWMLQKQKCYRKPRQSQKRNLWKRKTLPEGRKSKGHAPKSGATQSRAVHSAQEGEKVVQPRDHGSNDAGVTTDNGNDRVDVVKEPSFGN